MLVVSAIVIVLAVFLSPITGGSSLVLGMSLVTWMWIAVAVSVIAVGADIEWLQKAISIGGMIAGMYLSFGNPDWLLALISNGALTGSGFLLQSLAMIQGFVGNMGLVGKWALAVFSVWTTIGTVRAINDNTTIVDGMLSVLDEVVSGVTGLVTGVIGIGVDAVTGVVSGVIGSLFKSIFSSPLGLVLVGGAAIWMLSDDETSGNDIDNGQLSNEYSGREAQV